MGFRLSKIYTRQGDAGDTGLGDGERVRKSDTRVIAMGDVDELNAQIGLLVSRLTPESPHIGVLRDVQHRLFDLGGELSLPGESLVKAESVNTLEAQIDHLNEALAPLENFILPGGDEVTSLTHVARTVCRRAERTVVKLAESEEVNVEGLKYLNRLSDYLFVLARTLAAEGGVGEVLWRHS